jgi:hypothetical protein
MRAPRTTLALSSLPLLAALGACQAPPEVAYTTERLEIAPDFDYPVCEGTLEHLDGHVTFVEDQLTRWIPPGERIRFYWLTGGVEDWCSEGAAGCYYPGTRVVIGDSSTVTHEIVHAVLDAEARTNLFLEEALAEAFSGVGAYHDPEDDDRPAPSELLWLSPGEYKKGDLDYVVASHFMSYLRRAHGVVPIRGLAAQVVAGASPEELEYEFAHEFEQPFPALEAEYVEGAPNFIRGLGEDQASPARLGAAAIEVELDCGESHTYGPQADGSAGMFRVYQTRVEEAGEYELNFDGDPSLRLKIVDLRRQRAWGNVVDWHNPIAVDDDRLPQLEGGDRASVDLREGLHLLVFSTEGYDPNRATLQVEFVPPPDPSTQRTPGDPE